MDYDLEKLKLDFAMFGSNRWPQAKLTQNVNKYFSSTKV